jgi:chemotaxis response regulator CheB
MFAVSELRADWMDEPVRRSMTSCSVKVRTLADVAVLLSAASDDGARPVHAVEMRGADNATQDEARNALRFIGDTPD